VHNPTAADFTLTPGATGTSVTVTVTPPPNGATAMSAVSILRTSDGVNWSYLVSGGQTYTVNDTGLYGGTTYTYKIQFFNGDRSYVTPFSPPVNVQTPLVAPAMPPGFTGAVQSATSILWSWGDVANESGFKLIDPPNANAVKATLGPSILSYLETGLGENASISRALQATNASGASPPTGTLTFNTRVHDPTSSDFTLSVMSGNQINVAVTPPPNAGVGYTGVQIERSVDRINWSAPKPMSNVYTLSDTGLIGSTTYYYRIWLRNANASYNSPYSPIKSATTSPAVPPTPGGFNGTVKSTTSILWTWADVDGETGFKLLDPANANAVKATPGQAILSYLEGGLTENTSVQRTLIATNAAGSSGPTGALTRVTRVHDPVAADLSLSVVSGSQINVTVTPPPNGTAGYTGVQIDRSTDQVIWNTIKGMSSVYGVNDTNLLGGTTYYYRIWFRNSDASYNSPYYPRRQREHLAGRAARADAERERAGPGQHPVAWNIIPNENRVPAPGRIAPADRDDPAGTNTYTETGLAENSAYTRYICALNGAGTGPTSAAVTRTTWIRDPQAGDVTLSGVTATQINVTVTAPPNPTVGYTGVQIERSTDRVNWGVVRGMQNVYTFNDTGLVGGFTYYYRLWLRNGDATYNSQYSPIVSATTPAAAPTAPSFNSTTISPTSIQWNWSGVPAETNYVLHDANHAVIATVPPNLTTYVETGLLENTVYTRHVHAVNATGSSPASNSVSRATMVHDPVAADVSLTVVSGTQINVSVTPPTNPASDTAASRSTVRPTRSTGSTSRGCPASTASTTRD
jgi:hypothetical protein